MKKILFFGALSVLALSSCRKDDDDEQNTPTVVGIWKPSKEIVISGKNGAIISSEVSTTCYKKSTFDFKSNNTVTVDIYEENMDGACANYGKETLSYSYDAVTKKLKIEGEEDQEVLNLTSNEFQIVIEYSDVNNDNFDDKIVLVLVK